MWGGRARGQGSRRQPSVAVAIGRAQRSVCGRRRAGARYLAPTAARPAVRRTWSSGRAEGGRHGSDGNQNRARRGDDENEAPGWSEFGEDGVDEQRIETFFLCNQWQW